MFKNYQLGELVVLRKQKGGSKMNKHLQFEAGQALKLFRMGFSSDNILDFNNAVNVEIEEAEADFDNLESE